MSATVVTLCASPNSGRLCPPREILGRRVLEPLPAGDRVCLDAAFGRLDLLLGGTSRGRDEDAVAAAADRG